MHKDIFKRKLKLGQEEFAAPAPPPAVQQYSLQAIPQEKRWKLYFDEKKTVEVQPSGNRFRVYIATPSNNANDTVLVLMHGGGLTSMSWALCAVCMCVW